MNLSRAARICTREHSGGARCSNGDQTYRQLLAVRCVRGDRQAMIELVEHFERPLLFYLRRMLGDESEAWDCLQETWISVLRGLRRLRDPERLSAFLYRAARNRGLAHLRRRRSSEALLHAVPVPPESGDPEPAFDSDDARAVRDGLDHLPLLHREVLTLFFLDDMPIIDIADVLEIPPGTVKSRLHHAKRQLRAVLQQLGNRHEE